MLEFTPLIEMESQLERVITTLNSNIDDEERKRLIEKQDNLRNQFYDRGGLTFRSRTKSVLLGLGFTNDDLELSIDLLSGGQRNKAQLARVLMSDANLLLLDEPTNLLDIDAVTWLEDFLINYQKAFIVISHDRYFLDKVANRVFEIRNNKLFSSVGNYSRHLELSSTQNEVAMRHYLNTQKEIKRIYGIIEQQKRWNQARNYVTIASKLKQVDRLKATLVEPEKESDAIGFNFKAKINSGNDVIIAESLSKSFGDNHLFADLNLHIKKGDRVFLLGANGCGKTTLLKILARREKLDKGTFHYGTNVQMGFYEQNVNNSMGTGTLLDEIHNTYPFMNLGEVRNAMAQFLFKGDDVYKSASLASGGEQARVQLLKLMLSGANLLFLDEPTNHLDIDSRAALEKALESYDGTMLIVSHDRYLVNKLADRVLHITNNSLQEYLGGYDEFLAAQAESKAQKVEEKASKPNSYQQKKEFNSLLNRTRGELSRIEQRIHDIEDEIESLEIELAKPEVTSDYVKVIEFSEELGKKKTGVNDLYIEWEGLAIRLEKLESELEVEND
ncbi:MAG: ABC-F family ATP-binding cassette domain-containing protein [Clostridiales bacterium]|nr:ABC-F family ATP-binding cassette domain-containing protein [Clostridiales bacterium]